MLVVAMVGRGRVARLVGRISAMCACICVISALLVGCGGDCAFDADCTETGQVCQGGRCVARETTTSDGGNTIDSSGPQKECQDGFTRVCFSGDKARQDVGICKAGQQTCIDNKWSECVGEILPEEETCDGKDNDCDGQVDQGCDCKPGETQRCYTGPTGTAGKGICKEGSQSCDTSGKWGSCVGEVLPKAETCNQEDDNCDGKTDETCACKPGDTQPCYTGPQGTAGQGPCKQGSQACQADGTWGTCQGEILPGSEVCDGKDDDCDGTIDNGCDCKPGDTQTCYTGPAGTAGKGLCKEGSQACASGGKWGTCVGEVLPKAETCNRQDDNCDGQVDETCQCQPGETQACYNGPAGTDGKGPCKKGSQTCQMDGKWGACQGEVKPSAEACDGKDNDCDGQIDNNLQAPACGKQAGVCQGAKKTCGGANGWQACTDAQYKQHNALYETIESKCDGNDNDCDGMTDVGISRACYTGTTGCTAASGTYSCQGTCKAGTQTCVNGVFAACTGEILPKAEGCNQQDDDCDGQVDEGNPQGGQSCTVSGQQGLCAQGEERCINGQITCTQVNQPQAENCTNNIDDDCNGMVDDCAVCSAGQTRPCYTGTSGCTQSGTTYTCEGACKAGTQACVNGQWATTCTGDVKPTTESCNWTDDNCDGKADEGGACFYTTWTSSGTPNGVMHIAFYTPQVGVAVGTSGRIWRTTDGGSAWSTVTSSATAMLRHVAIHERGLVLAVGDSGTIMRSIDYGLTFTKITSGTTVPIFQVAIGSNGLYAVAVGLSGLILRSSDGGATWLRVTGATTQSLRAVAFRALSYSSVITVGNNGTILTSTDRGTTWTSRASGTTRTLSGAAWDSSSLVAVGAQGTVVRSTNASNWSLVTFPDTADLGAILSSGRDSFVTAATNGSAFYVSDDGGATFTKRSYGVTGSYSNITLQSPTRLLAYSLASGVAGEGPARFLAQKPSYTLRAVSYDNGFGSTVGIAAGTGGWVLRSGDSGKTWLPIYLPTTTTFYGATIDSDYAIVVGASGTMYRSADQGRTWSQITSGVTTTLYGVSIYGNNAVAVGSSGTILQSTDGGATWTRRTAPSGTGTLYGVSIKGSTAVAVGSSGRVLRSTDSGATWSQVGTGLTTATLYGVSLYDSTSDGVAVGSSGTALYTSNGGSSWVKTTTGTTRTLYAVSMDFSRAIVVGSSGELRVSADQGATWPSAATNTGLGRTLYGVFRNYASSNYVAVGTSSVLLRTSDYGVTWSANHFPSQTLRGSALQSSTTGVIAGTGGVVAKTTDAGGTWSFPFLSTASSIYGIARSTSGTMIAVGASSTIARSTNNGDAWTTVTAPASSTLYGVTSAGTSIFLAVGSSSRIFRSTNGGSSFVTIASPVSTTWRGTSCAGATCLVVGSSGNVLRSTNSGGSFGAVASGVTNTLYDVAMGSTSRAVIVGSSGRVLYTTNGGAAWTSVTAPSTSTLYGVTALSATRYLAVNSSGQMFASHDGGKTWTTHAPAVPYALYGVDIFGTSGFVLGSYSQRLLYTSP